MLTLAVIVPLVLPMPGLISRSCTLLSRAHITRKPVASVRCLPPHVEQVLLVCALCDGRMDAAVRVERDLTHARRPAPGLAG